MNKYKLLIIICFFLFTIHLTNVKAVISGNELIGKVICLDSGHGGIDSGAVNEHIIEKDYNLILAKKIEKELISHGAIVYQTRDGDYDLSTTVVNRKRSDLYNRAKYINNINPNMYISIHLNYISSSCWRGLQVFYTNQNKENKLIAEYITNYLKEKLSNVRKEKRSDSYYMYNNIKSPGILIEAGFISNPDDNYLLRKESYQDKLVLLITEAIMNYFKKNN